MENNRVIQAKPISLDRTTSKYAEYKLLTIKNPSSTCDDSDLLRVAYHLRSLIGYSEIKKEWFERGKQNQRHIHLVIKKFQMPSQEKLAKISASFKRGKYRWTEIHQANEGRPEPTLIEWSCSLRNFTWYLSEFKSNDHYDYVVNDYFMKEQRKFNAGTKWKGIDNTEPQFID